MTQPGHYFANPALTEKIAPWCTRLDNLEIAIVILSQPWVHGEGLQRAEIERSIQGLSTQLPLGQVYFQRINRCCNDLEIRGILSSAGRGRRRRFVITPEGFAALVLNLRWLEADPTIDGSEFELKRELVALWNQVHQHLLDIDQHSEIWGDFDAFFSKLINLRLFDRPVLDESTVAAAFDIHQLINLQQHRIQDRLDEAKRALQSLSDSSGLSAQIAATDLGTLPSPLSAEEVLEVARALADTSLPKLQITAKITRYQAYLAYLEDLHSLYERAFTVVDMSRLRVG